MPPSLPAASVLPRLRTRATLLLLAVLVAGCGGDTAGPEAPTIATVVVSPPSASLVVGQSTTFSATALDAAGQPIAGTTFTWSSTEPAVAEVDQDGGATALGSGQTTIRAEADGRSGEATLTVEMSPYLAPFQPLTDDTLTLVPLASNGVADLSGLAGVVVALDEAEETVGLTFVDGERNVVGGPLELAPDAGGREGQYRLAASGVSLLGYDDLTVLAWVSDPPLGESPLGIAIDSRAASAAGSGAAGAAVAPARGPEDREDELDEWERLKGDETITDLDRWSRLVQFIVDVNLEGATDRSTFVQEVTDDLVDVFINDADYRSWLIDGESVLGANDYIPDPAMYTGFAPVFRNGEGRFRHFSANAAVTEDEVPGPVVNLLARITGGDFNPEDDPTGDIGADLATNAVGRQFPAELERLWDRMEDGEDTERIDDGESVRTWMLDKFGAPVWSIMIDPEPFPEGEIGETVQLTATTLDAEGNVLTGLDVTWASSDPSIVEVDEDGVATRRAPGTATITATADNGVTGTLQAVVLDYILRVNGPSEIAFEHTVGVTPCLQQIATLTVRNAIDEPVQWSAVESAYGGAVRIDGEPGYGTLAPGESVTVTVRFLCSTDHSFTSTFEVNGTTGPQGRQVRLRIPVTGTIDATPGELTVTTSTSGEDPPEAYRVHDVELGTDLGTLGPGETKTFIDVRPGRYPVRLFPVPDDSNCSAEGTFVHDVVVPAGGAGSTAYSVSCVSNGPTVTIVSPEDGAVFEAGTLISFIGSATDPQDGVLPAEALEWTSSIDGVLCSGGGGCLRALSPGTHTITLRATDSDGRVGQAEITVTVREPRPDLRVSALTPSSVRIVPGEAAGAGVEVENAGTEEVAAGWTLELYLSADQVLDPDDVPVASAQGGALEPGSSESLDLSGTVPGATAFGEYRWIVVLDPQDVVEESDEANNVGVAEDPVTVGPPDLVTVSPAELAKEHLLQMSPCPDLVGVLTLTNPRDVPVTVTLDWSGGNEIEVSDPEVTIPAGGSADVDVHFTCSTTTSFSGTLHLSAASAEGEQAVDVPVSVSILRQGVVLAADLGDGFAAGTFVTLDRISGGAVFGPEAGCSETHLHGSPVILIDGMGPYADPNPGGCGYGVVTYGDPAG